ncbi:BofC N-terminal domain-containing protein [Pseudobacillus sp. FSL P4-0506]|uniref:BofC N-terminal domain-containing protein n=1 Tax=unclassified Pseudobacillus TaxID=2619284 RepID=UPI0030F6213C
MKGPVLVMLLLCVLSGGVYALREKEGEGLAAVQEKPHSVQVTLLEVGRDGQLRKSVHQEVIWAMEDFWSEYKGYQLVDMNAKEVIFEKRQ